MAEIEIYAEVHGSEAARKMLAAIGHQLPFVQSVAINATLNEIQQGIRDHVVLNPDFNLRRPDWILRTIYRRRGFWPDGDNASRHTLTGAVRIHPDRDILAKFEQGGEKWPRSGGELGVPVFRRQDPGVIIRRSSQYHLSKLPTVGEGKRRRGASVFAIRTPAGKFILERVRKGAVRVLWAFRRKVPIKRTLGFHETAIRVFEQRWEPNLAAGIERALKTSTR